MATFAEPHETLIARVDAYRQAWRERAKAPTATVARLLSMTHHGEPLADRVEKRLLEGRRELDNALAAFGGQVAAAIAGLTKTGGTEAIGRQTQEELLRVARTDETFENRMHEVASLVALHDRLATALGRD